MNRRELVKVIASSTVVISVGGVSIIACQDESYKPLFFSLESYDLLSDLSEYILPDSDESPGAKEAGVASFLDQYIPKCKSPKFQSEMLSTIENLGKIAQDKFTKTFPGLSREEAGEQINDYEVLEDSGYQELKSLILFAYFTSMEGMTKALRYVAIPGKYDGDLGYDINDKSWAI